MDSSKKDVEKLLSSFRSSRTTSANATGKPMAFGVTQDDKVVALDLQNKKVAWEQPAGGKTSRIVVGNRNIYYVADETTLTARSVRTGAKVWSRKEKLGKNREIYGIAAAKDKLYVVVGQKRGNIQGKWRSYIEAVNGRNGTVKWRREAPGRLGAPAAKGGYVFVPYRQQYVSVLDYEEGKERVRLRARGEFITFVRVTPEGIFFGGKNGVFKFNTKAVSGQKERADYLKMQFSEKKEKTGKGETKASKSNSATGLRVVYYWDGYEPVMFDYTAYDRNRLLWRGGRGDEFAKNHAVLEYFRYFFGFDTKTGELDWVHVHSGDDVKSAMHLGERLIYATEKGKLVVLNAVSGDRVWMHDFNVQLKGLTFDTEGFDAQGEVKKAEPVIVALRKIIFDADRRLAVAKLFAISQLKGLKGKKVSEILLGLISDRKLPLKLRLRAEKVLINRSNRDSIPLFMQVLKRRYNYITGERTRAVGPVALALATMKVKKGIPALAQHLQDPQTPLSTMKKIITAMSQIGGKEVLKPFRQFLLDYRADPGFKRQVDLLTKVASTLMENGSVAERQLLAFVAEDPHSLSPLREFVKRRLEGREQKTNAKK